MPSKTISLEQGAYELLARAKRPGESFSDVVRRMLEKQPPSLLDLVGILTPEAADELKATILEHRDQQARRAAERRRRSWGGD